MQTIMALYVASGALLAALSIPLIRRRVPRNLWYGFRVRQTLEDDAVWYAANEYAGRRLLGVGVTTMVAPLVLALWPHLTMDRYALACLAVTMSALAVCLVECFRYLRELTGP